MDFENARFNMIEQQIRPWDVLDPRVLDCLFAAKREEFVPADSRLLAFADLELPLPTGGHMLAPRVEARLLQALDVQPDDAALEIGTGSGYLTALLANMARHVYSVDLSAQASEIAAASLARNGVRNVTLSVGNGIDSDSKHAPFNVIVLGGSVPEMPEQLKTQLAPGGRLVAVVGEAPAMQAVLVTRGEGDNFREEVLFETVVEPLAQVKVPSRFVF
ncbi:protein-L-isoaspartate O-methyltransferase [Laribacter hongkongensis]|uniref:protein-L-isoaspartate O-methyltransferase family protein n=1 Tax=Laribacter hongkongensis TaxID=168471 RepID=UPI001878AF78|nr:protein-L-isoaspartate O-methyltransferase [Laribacter hongkongensis]MBE5528978.1 protein-L-isoaspartate O-methyltransferase [Laribacter hongkongensis]